MFVRGCLVFIFAGMVLSLFFSGCGDDHHHHERQDPPRQENPPRREDPPSIPPKPAEKPWPFPLPDLPWPKPEPTPQPTPQPTPSEDPTGLLFAINAARAKRGLSPVTLDAALVCAAQRHAKDIGASRTCGHTGSDGSSPWDRAKACGGEADGEIVACGQRSPSEAVDAWTNSPGHAAIMYDANQKKIGVAMDQNYWVAIFM